MSREQSAGQNGYIQIGNKSFETVEEFKYVETTVRNKNSIHAEIKSRLNSENALLAIIWCRIFCLPVCYPKM
jgi:hypothetical protein